MRLDYLNLVKKEEKIMAKKKKGKYIGFAKLAKKIGAKGDVKDPKAVAAAIGRKKYGKKTMQKAAAKGIKVPNLKKKKKK